MGQQSNIDWTDSTWNPIRGCTNISPGCVNCYAAKTARRFSGPGKPFEGLVRINGAGERTDDWNGEVHFVPEHLLDPLKWGEVFIESPSVVIGEDSNGNKYVAPKDSNGNKYVAPKDPAQLEDVVTASKSYRSRRIFVNSVSDLFHEKLERKHLVSIFAVMALCPEHVFQVLTKRAARMAEILHHGTLALEAEVRIEAGRILAGLFAAGSGFGVKSIHAILDQLKATSRNEYGSVVVEYKNPKWPLPNVLIGVSVENETYAGNRRPHLQEVASVGWKTFVSYEPALGPVYWDGWEFLSWLISGGESQAGARPSSPVWHEAARKFAEDHGIPYFFKQWGEWVGTMEGDPKPAKFTDSVALGYGGLAWLVGKKKAGHLLNGKEYRQFPEGL
jgi:protein gp37